MERGRGRRRDGKYFERRGARRGGRGSGPTRRDGNFVNAGGYDRHEGDRESHPNKIWPTGYKRLEEMEAKETPSNIVISLAAPKSGLEQRLRGDGGKLNSGMTQMLLKVFAKMSESDGPTMSLTHVLQLILTYDFHRDITEFVYGLLTEESPARRSVASLHINNALKLMNVLLTVLPSTSKKKVSMMMVILGAVINGLGGAAADSRELYGQVKATLDNLQEQQRIKKERASKSELANDLHSQAPPNDYREIPVFPQLSDIHGNVQPFLRTNLTDKAYQNVDHYVDVQFRLLREDFIRPLRDGIAEIMHYGESDKKGRKFFQNVKVYEDVRVLFTKPDNNRGILHKLHFSTEKLQYVRWKNTKRLLYGNLLCFSSDHFKNDVVFAVVADRKPEDLEQGYLTVEFVHDEEEAAGELDENDELLLSDSDDEFGAAMHIPARRNQQLSRVDIRKVYTMVETEAYFEAYRHVLAGLKATDAIPLERYIVHCSADMHAPEYIRPSVAGRVCYDFSSVADCSTAKSVEVLDYDWPTSEELGLDRTQAEALKLALTNELAIIQGPPGTGKTYVGLVIMKLLLANKTQWFSRREQLQTGKDHCPILVVCYTNHALDQFLEGIAKFSSKEQTMVRVGGRCKNEVTKEFSLGEVRRKRRMVNKGRGTDNAATRRTVWDLNNSLRTIEQQFQANCSALEASLHCILRLDELEHVIPAHLYRQFGEKSSMSGIGFWTKSKSPDVLLKWLEINTVSQEIDFIAEAHNLPDVSHAILLSLGHSLEDMGKAYHFTGNPEPMVLHDWITRRPQGASNAVGAEGGDISDEEEDGIAEEADFLQDQRQLDTGDNSQTISAKNRMRTQQEKEKRMQQLINKVAAVTFQEIGAGSEQSQEGVWQRTGRDKKKAKKYMKRQLGKTTTMTHAEESQVFNINYLNPDDRWRLYRTWVNRWRDQFRVGSDTQLQKFNRLARQLQELRKQEDIEILKTADVVAVTTTGAAKYRDLIHKLNCKIVIVEEAAEVLEAHVITAMPKSTKHLILIGDHQQLKPSPTVYELAKKYKLDISLFERLIEKVPHVTLSLQHRMRPAIADLLRPNIYKHLEDDESVRSYQDITGIQKSLFFLSHTVQEESDGDGRSKKNQFEADFLVALCKYIIMQGYRPEQITILAMYTGQLFAFRKTMRQQICAGVRVTAVDNFQGEENDIILLSLVRSNDEAKIGFLGIENRICVALSRAKQALYCIGNMELLGSKSLMWRKIIGKLESSNGIGDSLILQCKNHPDKRTPVKCVKDFMKVPEGGCGQPCAARLDCGHVCTRPCHPDDHTKYQCKKTCDKILCENEHRCKRKCFEECGQCTELVPKKMTRCGHEQRIMCYQSPSLTPCVKKVTALLPCGHNALVPCHLSSDLCPSMCKEKCPDFLECVHPCKGSCYECFQGRLHVPCVKKCGRTLVCGHACRSFCSWCPPCEEKCRTRCSHNECKKRCGEPCTMCREKCQWRCPHFKCTRLCSEPCDRPPCNSPCKKTLKCKHNCIGLCGEPCPTLCRICNKDKVTEMFFGDEDEDDARFVQLEDCKHIFTHQALDRWMKQKEVGNAIKMKECPRCKQTIWRSRRYGNIINGLLRSINKVKTKMCGDVGDTEINRSILKKVIGADTKLNELYPSQLRTIEHQLADSRTPLSPNKLLMLEERYRRLQRLGELREAEKKLTKNSLSNRVHVTALRQDMTCILKWVLLPRTHSTDQDKKSFQGEVERIKDMLKFIELEGKYGRMASASKAILSPYVTFLEKLLFEKTAPYDGETKLKAQRRFKVIFAKAPELKYNLGISEDEREMICQAMGFAAKGHWYTCSKGHVYAIGECGGATVTSVCPECQEQIGGTSHRLLSSNRVATEMDGATRPAYDPMNNFIPPDLDGFY